MSVYLLIYWYSHIQISFIVLYCIICAHTIVLFNVLIFLHIFADFILVYQISEEDDEKTERRDMYLRNLGELYGVEFELQDQTVGCCECRVCLCQAHTSQPSGVVSLCVLHMM